MTTEFFRLISRPCSHRSIPSSEQNSKCIHHGRDEPGHDEFSCEITDARNADGQITHRIASGLSALETLAQERHLRPSLPSSSPALSERCGSASRSCLANDPHRRVGCSPALFIPRACHSLLGRKKGRRPIWRSGGGILGAIQGYFRQGNRKGTAMPQVNIVR